jgi:phenylpropionate dioxygenase-like ring-hydroxylating dioxygenase large terminal subunit
VEYEICDQSILLVRQADRSVKAFHNACRHRATQLCKGAGRLAGGQIRCPFHGWRWNLDGTSSFIFGRDQFDESLLCPEEVNLQECLVELWGACVWINMDPQAEPLSEWLGTPAADLDAFGVEDLRVHWWQETVVNANWKIAQEAFHEAWHVMATHPQLTMGLGEDYPYAIVEYTAFPNGHGRFWGRFDKKKGGIAEGRVADEFLARSRVLWEGQDAMILERDLDVFERARNEVAPGDDFPTAAIQALIEHDLAVGIPIRTSPEAVRLWSGEVFLFPNMFYLPQFSNALSYRFRPHDDDPEWCRLEVWSLTMCPKGEEPGRAQLRGRFAGDDAEHWRLIPRQDISNMERQQRGVRSHGYDAHRLATEMELLITNMHQQLDRWLSD